MNSKTFQFLINLQPPIHAYYLCRINPFDQVRLPDGPDGRPAIAHGSRVKIRLEHPQGGWMDRLPAYIPWAT